MTSKTPSPNKKRIRDILGDGWTFKTIEYELCIYRDLGEYDIEIRGGRLSYQPIHIYVWKKRPYLEIVERHTNLNPFKDDIRTLCDGIVARYGAAAVKPDA